MVFKIWRYLWSQITQTTHSEHMADTVDTWKSNFSHFSSLHWRPSCSYSFVHFMAFLSTTSTGKCIKYNGKDKLQECYRSYFHVSDTFDEQQSYLGFHLFRFWARRKRGSKEILKSRGGRWGTEQEVMEKQGWHSIQSRRVSGELKHILRQVTVQEAKVNLAFSPGMTVEGVLKD